MTADLWLAANPGAITEHPTIEAAREWARVNGGSSGSATYLAITWPPVLPRIRTREAAA